MDAARAHRELVHGLGLAASGEWGAIRAYLGHRASLPAGPDRQMLREILVDEIRHRRIVIAMLHQLGGRLSPANERKLTIVGGSISAFCAVGGWFLPMAGAARLECGNIVEYEHLARYAHLAGQRTQIEPLLHLAEIEWDHELRLRTAAMTHRLWRLVPAWPVPPPRASIRGRFAAFLAHPRAPRRRRSLLVR